MGPTPVVVPSNPGLVLWPVTPARVPEYSFAVEVAVVWSVACFYTYCQPIGSSTEEEDHADVRLCVQKEALVIECSVNM